MPVDITTGKKSETGGKSTIDVTYTATVPSFTTTTVTLYEDVGQTGTANNQNSFTVGESAVVETFDGGLSSYGGDTGSATVVSGGIDPNKNYLEISANKLTKNTIADTDVTLSVDIKVRFWMTTLTKASAGTATNIFAQSETSKPDGYVCSINKDDGDNKDLELDYRSGGNRTTLGSSSSPVLTDGEIYEFEFVAKSDGTRELALLEDDNFDEHRISATDSTFSSGGIGFENLNDAGSSSTQYFDAVVKDTTFQTSYSSASTTLSGFDGGGSTNDYWLQVDLAGNESDPTLDSPTLSSVSFDAVGATIESATVSGAGGVAVTETVKTTETESATVTGAGSVAVSETLPTVASESVTVSGGGSVAVSETTLDIAFESATVSGSADVNAAETVFVVKTESVAVSGSADVTAAESVIASVDESVTVSGGGTVSITDGLALSESAAVSGSATLAVAEGIIIPESATITGGGAVAVSEQAIVRWRIDNTIIQPTSDITATPTTLSLTFEVDRSNIGTWRAYDTAGDFDTVDGHGGHFRTVDRAGRSSSVTVVAGSNESPPFTTAEYYVSSYGETQLAADRIQVSLQLRRLSNRDGAFSAVSQTGGDWQFDTDSGTVALDQAHVSRATVEGTTVNSQWGLSVRLTGSEAATLLDDFGYPGGIVERPAPDAENTLVDNSPNSQQTVTLTTPSTAVLSDGDYYVRDWRIRQSGYGPDRRWRVELTLAE